MADFPAKVYLPPDDMASLSMAIGHVVINWGIAESAINTWVSGIFRYAGGRHVEDEIPRAFSRKVKFLRRCFARITILGPHKAQCLEALEIASKLSLRRNDIIHSYVSSYDPVTGKFTFTNLDSVGNQPTISQIHLTTHEILALDGECLKLGAIVTTLGLSLLGVVIP